MARGKTRSPVGIYGLMLLAFLATFVFAIIIIRSVPQSDFWRGAPDPPPRLGGGGGGGGGDDDGDDAFDAPVAAVITASDRTVSRSLPAASFRLERGQSLDPRVPAGPFTATIAARLDPGSVREATLGAQWQGGQLIVRRGGEIVISDYAGPEPRQTLTIAPGPVLTDGEVIEYELTADGDGVAALRALWQPMGSLVALPLPVISTPPRPAARERGRLLAQRLNCAACHASDRPARQTRLAASRAPLLGAVGARTRPAWLRRWLLDPAAVKPGTRMPSLVHGGGGHAGGLEAGDVEDLVHFLVSLGGPIADEARPATDGALAETGRVLYHRVGCVPCHGPLEPPDTMPALTGGTGGTGGAGGDTGSTPLRVYAGLDGLAAKTTAARLAAFLRDPLAVRPSGLMPGQQLDEMEAEAIAAYLVGREGASSGGAGPAFALDAARAARGRATFARAGCASCHELGPDRTPITSTLAVPSLESLATLARPEASAMPGCLGPSPPAAAPRYGLDDRQRGDLRAYLASLPEIENDDVPLDDLLTTVRRLNCTACHAFHGDLGPEAAILPYFVTDGEADLGDEGRLPPNLTNAGARLTTAWMRDVLLEGERARPYIASRMPDYGDANVGRVPDLLAAAAGATTLLDLEPEFSTGAATAGRELVGAKGLNCIQCHEIAGNASTGTTGPDLALMPGRLRYEGFERWLHDPARIRPGTRMPSFFVAGRSAATGIFGGRADAQVGAIWAYLSQGEMLALPEGLADPAGLELVVRDEPVVFRTFMQAAGVRAIACGFPEQVHCAFDADRCVVSAAWQGRFLSAQGAWGARGGAETNPGATSWTAPDGPLLEIDDATATAARFRGYRLDAARRPIFRYTLAAGDASVAVEERPTPVIDERGPRLVRRFAMTGPPGRRVAIHAGDLPVEGDNTVRDDTRPGTVVFALDDAGRGGFELEVTW